MNEISPPTTSKPSGRLRRVVLNVLLVLVGSAIVVFAIWRICLAIELNRQIAAIRAEGLPTTWKELSQWKAGVPDDENAALVYLKTISGLHVENIPAQQMAEPNFLIRGQKLSDEQRTLLEAIIETNSAVFEKAHQAALLPKSHYPVTYSDGPTTELPHLDGLKDLARLLECDALLKADEGDFDGAADSIITSVAAARSLDTEPDLISQLVATSMMAIEVDSFQRVLNFGPVSDKLLSTLAGQLADEEKQERFVMALTGERALENEFLQLGPSDMKKMNADLHSPADEGTEVVPSQWSFMLRFVGFFERDRAFFLRAMDTNIAIARLSPPASLAASNVMEQMEAKAQNGDYIICSLILTSVSFPIFRDADFRAHLRTAYTAAGIERWRAAHDGNVPESLAVLVPDFLPKIPEDPYDGQPLRFKPLAHGYVVYSIGRDLKDDGGKERPPRSAKIPLEERYRYDITFTVER